MASSSKQSRRQNQKNGRKTMKLTEWYPEWEQDTERRNRPIENLPPELILMILMKLDVVQLLFNAQLVCTLWYKICKDPFMWKYIDIAKISKRVAKYTKDSYFDGDNFCARIINHAVDRSCGQLVDVNIGYDGCYYCDLPDIAYRSPCLTRLRLHHSDSTTDGGLIEAISKLPLLTDIDLSYCTFSEKAIEAIGRCCPLLKSFKFNWREFNWHEVDFYDSDQEDYRNFYKWDTVSFDKEAFAIAANMPGLHHLVLFGNRLSNHGLRAILDGCSHLVSLDLRSCSFIELDSDLGKRCCEQIKDLRGPCEDRESLHSYGIEAENFSSSEDDGNDYDSDDDDDFRRFSGRQYDGYLYDEYDEIVNTKKFIDMFVHTTLLS